MENNINIYVVEDMAIPRASLEIMLQKNGYLLAGSAAKAEIAWEEIQKLTVDLILLDINLAGEENGIWLAQQVRRELQIPIIFLTAYSDQQTLKKVLETKPNGYLIKPYQEATLLITITIAFTNFITNQKEVVNTKSAISNYNHIFIKDKYIRIKLLINEILFVKSEGNYLEIKLIGKTYVIRCKLSDFMKLLPKQIFIKSHQRYIVNINKVDIVGKDFLSINKIDIPISKKHKIAIETALKFL